MMRFGKCLAGLLAIGSVLGIVLIMSERRSPGRQELIVDVAKRADTGLASACETRELRFGAPVFIRIFKESKELEVLMEIEPGGPFELWKTYAVANWGDGHLGPKLAEGDGQAPEGFYSVELRQLNPQSQFHLAMNIGYPNEFDRSNGRTGSFIMIHGGDSSIGCFAMTDQQIEEIYALVEAALSGGQRSIAVHIFPFRLTEGRLEAASDSEWIGFWQNLREGFDAFERSRRPPSVSIHNQRYVFK